MDPHCRDCVALIAFRDSQMYGSFAIYARDGWCGRNDEVLLLGALLEADAADPPVCRSDPALTKPVATHAHQRRLRASVLSADTTVLVAGPTYGPRMIDRTCNVRLTG